MNKLMSYVTSDRSNRVYISPDTYVDIHTLHASYQEELGVSEVGPIELFGDVLRFWFFLPQQLQEQIVERDLEGKFGNVSIGSRFGGVI